MIYQELFRYNNSYVAAFMQAKSFPPHRHHEIEIIYALKNSFIIKIEGNTFNVRQGEMIIIPHFSAHEITDSDEDSKQLLIEGGPSLLGNAFDELSALNIDNPVIRLSDSSFGEKFSSVIEEIIAEKSSPSTGSELTVKGNIIRLFGYIIEEFPVSDNKNASKDIVQIKNIETVLDLIYSNYSANLTVDKAAEVSGYGKSNFCKIFKNTVGTSFHRYLNGYRIKMAKYYLKNTKLSINEIAELTGFSDAKTFRRVFKEFENMTPREFSNQ